MTIIEAMKQLRDDLKLWVAYNLREKVDKDGDKVLSTNDFSNEHKSKLENLGDIIEDENGDMTVADEDGNIIFKIDSDGVHTTALMIKGIDVIDREAVQEMIDESIANIAIYEGETEPVPFEFTVNGITCSADEGMTWAEWVASDYNTIGASTYSITRPAVFRDTTYVVDSDGVVLGKSELAKELELASNTIVAGIAYVTARTYDFSVDSNTYTATAGMTWYEWITDGSYTGSGLFSTDGNGSIVDKGSLVVYIGDGSQMASSALIVTSDDRITPEGIYYATEYISDVGGAVSDE